MGKQTFFKREKKMFFQIGQIPEIELGAEEGMRSIRNLNLLDSVK